MFRRCVLTLCFAQLISLFALTSLYAGQESVRVSGFVRAAGAAVLGDGPDYLGRIDRDGDAGETEFGVNLYADLGQGYVVVGQLWGGGVEAEPANGNGPPVERYKMVIDWAFITRHFGDAVSLSAGKMKYPNLLVSEYVDVGLAYPWVRPPEEMYNFETDGPYLSLESFEGASFNYTRPLADAEFHLQAYTGQSIVEDGQLERMMGMKIALQADNYRFQVAHNRHLMDTVGLERGALQGETASITSVGMSADMANIVLYAEYATSIAGDARVSAYYATMGYQYHKWLPHITLADVENTEGWGQSSLTAGLKFQLIPAAALKIEFKNIAPHVTEEPDESGGFFNSGLASDNASIISTSIDVVF